MNLILVSPEEVAGGGRLAVLRGRRCDHIRQVHRAEPGIVLRAGMLGGLMGKALVRTVDTSQVELELELSEAPPPKLPLLLILALPRPKMLRRVLQTVAAMGVARLYLVNSYRVEKAYWQTPLLEAAEIRENLLAGLEQACDTVLPEVCLRQRFKPFAEDELPELAGDSLKLVAHPAAASPCPGAVDTATTLAVGPEGGFIDFELNLFQSGGFSPVSLGPRILRVETAVPALLGRLFQ